MSLLRVHQEFIVEADRLRRAVAISAMSVRDAKRRIREIAADLIEDEVEERKEDMRRLVAEAIKADEL